MSQKIGLRAHPHLKNLFLLENFVNISHLG
jgi:hypothetical protein